MLPHVFLQRCSRHLPFLVVFLTILLVLRVILVLILISPTFSLPTATTVPMLFPIPLVPIPFVWHTIAFQINLLPSLFLIPLLRVVHVVCILRCHPHLIYHRRRCLCHPRCCHCDCHCVLVQPTRPNLLLLSILDLLMFVLHFSLLLQLPIQVQYFFLSLIF